MKNIQVTICVHYLKKCNEWNIENQIACVVSDNAANILLAVRTGGWNSQICFAHTYNLIVQNGLKKVENTINKVKNIVTF